MASLKDEVSTERLRIGLSIFTVSALPAWSKGPRGAPQEVLAAIRAAGFETVQTTDAAAARAAGLIPTALLRVDEAAKLRTVAQRHRDKGFVSTTLHLGTGLESDIEARALVEMVAEASALTAHPLFVETHRATLTQDMKRTLDLIALAPALRFTGDFSHWYTGLEMPYGDMEAKIARLEPVFSRVRMLHGRVSSPGCIQVPVRDGANEKNLAVFWRFWTLCFKGFLAQAGEGDCFDFCPELLPSAIDYARSVKLPSGEITEECDRWLEALYLVDVARQCWAEAVAGNSGAG